MNSLILGMLAETSIHPGAGQSAGFVDLPVAREAATDYPVIVGSSLKGALRDAGLRQLGKEGEDIINKVFGEQENAGQILVSDARLLLLPVRTLTGHYRWLTCPHLLLRLARDLARAKQSDSFLDASIFEAFKKGQHLVLGKHSNEKENLFLEERQFEFAGTVPSAVINAIKPLFEDPPTADTLEDRLVIVSDADFAWFARYGLAISARNVLDDEKKTSKNLWYEETIPSDSLFYALIAERGGGALNHVKETFKAHPYLQVGGNETVGQGWFAIEILDQKGGA